MFFFFPFVAELAATQRAPQYKPLLSLPQSQSARRDARPENGLTSLAVDLLKQALSSIAASMTALGNSANALFAQIAGTLAYDRMAREAASFFGLFWPGFAQAKPQLGFAGPWIAPAPQPPLFACFGLPQYRANPWPLNPWAPLAEALDMWTSLLAPAPSPQRRGAYGTAAPVTTTFAVPGFSWGFTLG